MSDSENEKVNQVLFLEYWGQYSREVLNAKLHEIRVKFGLLDSYGYISFVRLGPGHVASGWLVSVMKIEDLNENTHAWQRVTLEGAPTGIDESGNIWRGEYRSSRELLRA